MEDIFIRFGSRQLKTGKKQFGPETLVEIEKFMLTRQEKEIEPQAPTFSSNKVLIDTSVH
ncbi:16510_t:CDS:2 [Entrophospora sp. SA101]|nr:16510_t:CDS:2 [Entrophospora sp. SA101]